MEDEISWVVAIAVSLTTAVSLHVFEDSLGIAWCCVVLFYAWYSDFPTGSEGPTKQDAPAMNPHGSAVYPTPIPDQELAPLDMLEATSGLNQLVSPDISALEDKLWVLSTSGLSETQKGWFDIDLKVRNLRGSEFIQSLKKREVYLKKKLVDTADFRTKHSFQTILSSPHRFPHTDLFREECWPMKMLAKGDSHGHLVVRVQLSKIQFQKVKHGPYLPTVIDYFVFHQETLLRRARAHYEAANHVQPVVQPKYSLILDLRNFGLVELREVYYGGFFAEVAGMWGINYPDTLFRIYLCNAPLVLTMGLKLVKPFMEPDTIEKLRVVSSNLEAFAADGISKQALPICLGGLDYGSWVLE
jgi:hypothetical protein